MSHPAKERLYRSRARLRELVLFSMLGALLFAGKLVMEAVPNVHPVAALIAVYTVVYRKKALIPLGVYVVLLGVYMGFSPWWVPNLYVWTVLWGAVMLLPRTPSAATASVLYPAVCALFGLFYGVLWAPAQALLFHLDVPGMLSWIAAGFWFDVLHAVGNLAMGLTVYPLSRLLLRLKEKRTA